MENINISIANILTYEFSKDERLIFEEYFYKKIKHQMYHFRDVLNEIWSDVI